MSKPRPRSTKNRSLPSRLHVGLELDLGRACEPRDVAAAGPDDADVEVAAGVDRHGDRPAVRAPLGLEVLPGAFVSASASPPSAGTFQMSPCIENASHFPSGLQLGSEGPVVTSGKR